MAKRTVSLADERGIAKRFYFGDSIMMFRGAEGKPVDVDALLDGLTAHGVIGGARRNVAADLSAGRLPRPMGRWGLVVRLAGQPWTYLVGDRLRYEWPREVAQQLGMRVACFFANGLIGRLEAFACEKEKLLVEFLAGPSEGPNDDAPSDAIFKDIDGDGIRIRGALLDSAWLAKQRSLDKAWRAVAVALDAYVPFIRHRHDNGVAGVEVVGRRKLKAEEIERVDIITFGPPETLEPTQAAYDLARAIDAGNADAVRAAVAAGASVEHLPDRDESPLIACLHLGLGGTYDALYARITRAQQLDVLKALLEAGANPNPPGGDSAIGEVMEHIEHGDERTPIRLLTMLIEHGADPNAPSDGVFFAGNRPLFVAALRNKLAITKFVLAHGADPLLPSANGMTPREQLSPFMERQEADTGEDVMAMFSEAFAKLGGEEAAAVFESYMDGKPDEDEGPATIRRQQSISDTNRKRSTADEVLDLLKAAESGAADTSDWAALAEASYHAYAEHTRAWRRRLWRDDRELYQELDKEAGRSRYDTLDGHEPVTLE